jgi:hypothetical protein
MHLRNLDGSSSNLFTRITEQWSLTALQRERLFGNPGEVARMCHVLEIYCALRALFPDPNIAGGWIHLRHMEPPFDGRRAIDVMMDGNINGFRQVIRYLNSQGRSTIAR